MEFKSRKLMFSQKVITPDLAKYILQNLNKNNRSIASTKVEMYARDMTKGGWVENGESIKFNTEGYLLDGQHRLHACVKSNTPFITTLVLGVASPDAFKTIDTGRGRNPTQVLQMAGINNSSAVAAAVRIVMHWDTTLNKSQFKAISQRGVTNDEVLSKVMEFSPQALKEGYSFSKKIPRGGGRASFFAVYLLLQRASPEKGKEFFQKYEEGLFTSKHDPLKLLQDRVIRKLGRWSLPEERTELMALIIKTFNVFCGSSLPMKRLVWNENSGFPIPVVT